MKRIKPKERNIATALLIGQNKSKRGDQNDNKFNQCNHKNSFNIYREARVKDGE
jgi:hypothetical protein